MSENDLPHGTANFPSAPLCLLAAAAALAGGVALGGRVALSTSVGRLQWIASVRADGNRSGAGPRAGALTVGLDAFAASLGAGLLQRATVRAGIDVSGSDGTQRLRLAAGLPLSGAVRVETGVSWHAGDHSARWTMLIVGDLPSVRTSTSIDQSPGSGVQQTIQGSLLLDPTRHGIIARGLPALSRGGVSGRACLDYNGDGICSASEPGVAGLRVIAA